MCCLGDLSGDFFPVLHDGVLYHATNRIGLVALALSTVCSGHHQLFHFRVLFALFSTFQDFLELLKTLIPLMG